MLYYMTDISEQSLEVSMAIYYLLSHGAYTLLHVWYDINVIYQNWFESWVLKYTKLVSHVAYILLSVWFDINVIYKNGFERSASCITNLQSCLAYPLLPV